MRCGRLKLPRRPCQRVLQSVPFRLQFADFAGGFGQVRQGSLVRRKELGELPPQRFQFGRKLVPALVGSRGLIFRTTLQFASVGDLEHDVFLNTLETLRTLSQLDG